MEWESKAGRSERKSVKSVKSQRESGRGGIGREFRHHEGRFFTVQSLPVLNSALACWDFACVHPHLYRTGVRSATGHLPCRRLDCRIVAAAAGGALGSKGSWARQRPLPRWRRIRSTTRGSVIKETMRMRAPQLHRRGSASKIFLINRAHVLRVSLEKSESSCWGGGALPIG